MSEFWSDTKAMAAFLDEWEARHVYDEEHVVRRADLVDLLARRRGAYPLGIISRTVPSKLRQKLSVEDAVQHFPLEAEAAQQRDAKYVDCPHFRPESEGSRKKVCTLFKLAAVNGFVNVDYEAGVNRRREKEGKEADFEAAETWYVHRCNEGSPHYDPECPPCVVDHKDGERVYVQIFGRSSKLSRYVQQGTGREVDPSTVVPFLSKSKPSRQGLEDELLVNTYRLDHVVELHLGVKVGDVWQKHRYIVQDNVVGVGVA